MYLGYIIIYVLNVSETISFYEKAFGLKLRFMHENNQYAEMETGKTTLAFANENFAMASLQCRPNRQKEQAAGVEIALVVENVEEAFKHAVISEAVEIAKPTQKPWGQIVSYVRDNNGFLVELCSAIVW